MCVCVCVCDNGAELRHAHYYVTPPLRNTHALELRNREGGVAAAVLIHYDRSVPR